MAASFGFTAAAITACALGLSFRSTRLLGIAAAAALSFTHPLASIVALVLGFAIFIFIRYYRKEIYASCFRFCA